MTFQENRTLDIFVMMCRRNRRVRWFAVVLRIKRVYGSGICLLESRMADIKLNEVQSGNPIKFTNQLYQKLCTRFPI